MQREPAAKLRGRVGLILLVAVAAAVWWGLDRAERHVTWLRVEAPRHAVAGQPLPLRVHVAPLKQAAYLCADLHWGTSRDTSRGYLATGGAKAVGKQGGTFDFDIPIPPTQGLRFVTGILFLSRTSSWQDHTRVAATEVIPVSSNALGTVESRLEPLRLQPPGDGITGHPRPAAFPRLLTALLFLAATVSAWGARPVTRRSQQAARSGEPLVAGAGRAAGAGLPVGVARAGELAARACADDGARGGFLLPARCVSEGRHQRGHRRHHPFVPVPSAHEPRRRLLVGSFALYLAIALVNLVSWHPIDQVADLSWHGLMLVQALKLGCAAITLRGVVIAGRDVP